MPLCVPVDHSHDLLKAFRSMQRPHFVYHSLTDKHLKGFQILAFMNKAALSIRVQLFVWTCVFTSLETEWLDHIIDVCFTVLVFSDDQMHNSFE